MEERKVGSAAKSEEEEEGLEEEDLELLQENLRRSGGSGFLRLRRREDEEGGESGSGDDYISKPQKTGKKGHLGWPSSEEEEEEEEAALLGRKRVAPEELERLFDDEEAESTPTSQPKPTSRDDKSTRYDAERERALLYGGSDEEEDDELADFIEEDEAGAERGVAPSRRVSETDRKGSATRTYLEEAFGGRLPGRALKDILDIFGDGTDYLGLLDDDNDDEEGRHAVHLASSDQGDSSGEERIGDGELRTEDDSVRRLGQRMREAGLGGKAKSLADERELLITRDIPERIQQRDGAETRPAPEPEEIEAEAAWIAAGWISDRQMAEKYSTVDLAALKGVISSVLRLFRESLLEVPTVATHRKEYFQHLMGLTELWAIWDADERWRLIWRQQKVMLQQIDQLAEAVGNQLEAEERALLVQVVKMADSLEVLEVAGEYLRWFRRQCTPQNSRLFQKLQEMTRQSTLSLPLFVENMQKQRADHRPPTPELGILELSGLLPETEMVVTPAMLTLHLAAFMGHHPWGQLSMRTTLEHIAAINVSPTLRGVTEIDLQHELAPIKYVKEKPIGSFQEDQFLLLLKGHKMGLLQHVVTFPGLRETMDHLLGLFGAAETSSDLVEGEWIEMRRNALIKMVEEHVLPRLRRDILAKLQNAAERWVATTGQYMLQEKLMMMPYDPVKSGHPVALAGRSNIRGFRVMGVSWGRGGPDAVAMVAVVDERGRVVEQLKIPQLHPKHRGGHQQEEKWTALRQAIIEHEPSCIVVAGRSLDTRDLYEGIRDLSKSIAASSATAPKGGRRTSKHPSRQQSSAEMQPIPVVYGEDDTARIFSDSPRGLREFPASEVPSLMRYCVSLARRWINPLFELAALNDSELLVLDPTLMAPLVDRELCLRYLQRAFVNVVNLVGVDINAAVEASWMRTPLKYVCGLGPVKAEALTKAIGSQGTGRLACRTELLHQNILGPCVFANCASFLRIPQPSTAKERKVLSDATDPLDCTRIHPENYPLAIKIATDATVDSSVPEGEEDDEDLDADGRAGSDAAKRAVRLAMSQPEKLDDLLLDEYAKELIKRGQPPKHLTLLDIKSELQAPYADLRTPSRGPSDEALFEMLTGETEKTLWAGSVVRAVVHRVSDRHLYCRLESGIEGILPQRHSRSGADADGAPRVGQMVMVKVRSIDPVRMEVELVGPVRPDEPVEARFGTDPYYDFEAAKQPTRATASAGNVPERSATATGMGESASLRLHKSITSHPAFRDVGRVEAEQLLKDASLGEVIFRPSANPDQFNLTWKVGGEGGGASNGSGAAALYQHIPIRRKSNGHFLLLEDNLEYEELDEIIARHVEALAGYIRDVRATPKYFSPGEEASLSGAARDAVEQHLKTRRQQEPTRIAYCFSLSQERPGHLLLSYLPSSRVYHELVQITPFGYKLRGVLHGRIEELVDWFKANYRNIPQASSRETAAPATTTTTRGSAADDHYRHQARHRSSSSRNHRNDDYQRGDTRGAGSGRRGEDSGSQRSSRYEDYRHDRYRYERRR